MTDERPVWEAWFETNRDLRIDAHRWVEYSFPIEELYQMFKARMMAEMMEAESPDGQPAEHRHTVRQPRPK